MSKLHLNFKDRVGIVADISSQIARHGLNIMTMEVVQEAGHAHVFVELDHGDRPCPREDILTMLAVFPDLIEISFVNAMPHEKQSSLLRTVLDNVDESVVAVDAKGCVTMINSVAESSFKCRREEVLGRHVRDLRLPDCSILGCLDGEPFSNAKCSMLHGRKRMHYFVTGRPIVDASGDVTGAVAVIKDAQEIQSLAKTMCEPDQISFSDIIGTSAGLRQVTAVAEKIAATDAIVTIRGESGTGKDLLAQAIHTGSGRGGQFVAINCAAVPEALLESELFGYVGGAFSGARKEGRPGLFELAGEGTVFLDEIAEMPLSAQAKILRLIQSLRLRRLGGDQEIPVRARIVTATNRNLEDLVERRLFREDLYYRINVLPLHIPPLRERPEDIPVLADHFLFQLSSRLGKGLLSFAPPAREKLLKHHWPGNVRELKNVVERSAILCESNRIDADSILLVHGLGREGPAAPRVAGGRGESLRSALDRYERSILVAALGDKKSIRQAAKSLGISHTALRNKLRKHRMES
ncbi:putative sigma54 specific transcriptional regulator [Desulfovibrio sp. X2]|uniref:sigma 54-interacting transcriptional regulator n=1 Tax=Desulfovibrio sp. X2 TaxID=941449 RepID=UPI000358CF4F|nr:sigma 54-interacting transcriptional regulator [Desulfovibrio sp. X2]EPR40848.1 putative sigma54 specific transcriptional regulator [Desulfovibrio sp. X2]